MVIFLDTETTGVYPGNICQFSYIMQEKNNTTARNMYFSVQSVESGAYAVHGLSVPLLKKLSGGKVFSDRIEEIESDLSRADVIVAHNTAFDLMFLRKEFENCNRVFTYKNEFCSMKKFTPICKLKRLNSFGYKYPKLTELCNFLQISDDEILTATKTLFSESNSFHDARFDTTAVYLAINKAVGNFAELDTLKNFL